MKYLAESVKGQRLRLRLRRRRCERARERWVERNFGFRTFFAAKPHACPVFSGSGMCVRLWERVISDFEF